MLKKLDRLVKNILDNLEKGPDRIAFVELTNKLNPKPTSQPFLSYYRDLCKQRIAGNLSPFSVPGVSPEECGNIASLIEAIRENRTSQILDKFTQALVKKRPFSSWNIMTILILSEGVLDHANSSPLNTLCEKLLLHFEVRKSLRLSDSRLKNSTLAMAALSCLFIHQFGLKDDWRFFNVALKINDIIYFIFSKHLVEKWGEIGYLASLLAWRTLSIQENTFSRLEKQ